jgi:hypothetical protein
MKTIYPFLTLLSIATVAAGPLPRHARLAARVNIDQPSRVLARTEHLGEAAPAAAPDAAKEAADAMESMHVAKAEAEEKAHQEKAEAEEKAHQEGMYYILELSCFFSN